MMSELTNPHDRFFKEALSRQEVAVDFLQHYLPSEVAALLDLSSLQLIKDSFGDVSRGRAVADSTGLPELVQAAGGVARVFAGLPLLAVRSIGV
jgi:hypothetical protein